MDGASTCTLFSASCNAQLEVEDTLVPQTSLRRILQVVFSSRLKRRISVAAATYYTVPYVPTRTEYLMLLETQRSVFITDPWYLKR